MRIFGQKPVEAAQAKPGKPTMPGPARLAPRGVSVGPDFSRMTAGLFNALDAVRSERVSERA